MKDEEISELIKHRLEQAQVVLDDAKFLLEGKRSALLFLDYVVQITYPTSFYRILFFLK